VALYVPLQGMLIGLGRIKYLIKQSLVMAVINLSLLLILVPHFGITGAAWAYFIAVLPMCAAFYWTERRLFNLTDQVQRYIKLYAKLLATAFFSGLLMYYLLVPLTKSIIHLVIIGPLSVLLYFVLFYLFGFMEKDDSDILKKFIIKFLRLSR
jgi:O-antigen/teichoic acid export membrane protein